MSNYNVGDLIRLTRQSLGISQEELSDGICSVQTLSRIENGKVAVKRITYQQLMERMGRNGQKNYSVLSLDEFELLDEMRMAHNLLFRKEYAETQKHLNVLKEKLDKNDIINIQYLKKTDAILNYRNGVISEEEYLKELEDTIALTIPNYKRFLDKIYPFTVEEVRILMNIAIAYGELEEYEMAIAIYDMLLKSLNSGYMEQKKSVLFILIVMHGKARMHGGLGQHQLAIEMGWEVIEKAKEYNLFSTITNTYGGIAWNMMEQIEKGERDETDKSMCKEIMRQGYAVAALTKQNVLKEMIGKEYYKYFNEPIYSCMSWENI